MTDRPGIIDFGDAETQFAKLSVSAATIGAPIAPQIVELFVDENILIPFHARTGQQAMGDIAERKKFKYIEFHGYGVNPGTVRVRVYIDGHYVCDGQATLSETPDKKRRINIPIGMQLGYTVDIEFCGNACPRAIEFTYEGTNSVS